MNARVEQRERSRETILASAARLLRGQGIGGTTVGDVMRGAGLTAGGFYAHFESKEALLTDVLRRCSAELRTRLFNDLDGIAREDRLGLVLKRYLSRQHRDDAAEGCALPAVVGEVGTTARDYDAVVAEQVDAIAAVLEDDVVDDAFVTKRASALALVALMYGGLSLARAVAGTPLSDEILKACKDVGQRLR